MYSVAMLSLASCVRRIAPLNSRPVTVTLTSTTGERQRASFDGASQIATRWSTVLCERLSGGKEGAMGVVGGGLLLVVCDAAPGQEEELERWYEDQHLYERSAIDGFYFSRRYISLRGEPSSL